MRKGKLHMMMDNKQQDILYLRKRAIFEESRFKYVLGFLIEYSIFIGCILLGVDCIYGAGTFTELHIKISVLIGIVICLLILMTAMIDNGKHNRLIENGKLIIAEIDESFSTINPLIPFCIYEKVKCSYFDAQTGQFWEFAGKYIEFWVRRRRLNSTAALRDERYIPVLVDEKDYGKYYVLTQELVYSYRTGFLETPPHFTKVKRKIDLTQVENGTKFSSYVKFH